MRGHRALTRLYAAPTTAGSSIGAPDSDGRLIPVAHVSLFDPEAAATELERAVKDGCKGGWFGSVHPYRKPHGHPDHDALFAKAQEFDVPLGLHPTVQPLWTESGRYAANIRATICSFNNVIGTDAARHALTSFMQYGTFDQFPRLKIVLLEVGAGWISYLAGPDGRRLQQLFRPRPAAQGKAQLLLQTQHLISADPDEHSLPAMIELCGEDRFFWASDFPHPDHIGDYLEELEETAGKLTPSASRKLMGENVKQAYHLAV